MQRQDQMQIVQDATGDHRWWRWRTDNAINALLKVVLEQVIPEQIHNPVEKEFEMCELNSVMWIGF